jgi:AraC-like DNA-binding protein
MKKLQSFLLRCLLLLSPTLGFAQQSYQDPHIEQQLYLIHTYPQLKTYVLDRLQKNEVSITANEKIYLYNKLTRITSTLGENEQSRRFAQKAEALLSQTNDSILIYEHRLIDVEIKLAKGESKELVSQVDDCYRFAVRSKNVRMERSALFNLSKLAYYNGMARDAIDYHKKALNISQQHLQGVFDGIDLCMLGAKYLSINPDSAFLLINQGLDIAQSKQDWFTLATGNLIKSSMLQIRQDYTNFEKCIQLTIAYSKQIGFYNLYFMAQQQLMAHALQQKKYQQVITLGETLKNENDIFTNKSNASFTDTLLYEAYKAVGNYEQALKSLFAFHQKYTAYTNSQLINALNDLKNQRLIDEKNTALLSQQLTITKQRKRFLILFMAFLFLATLVISYFLIKLYQKRLRKTIFEKDKNNDLLLEEVKQSQMGPISNCIDQVQIPAELDATHEQEIEIISPEREDLFREMIHIIESKKLYLNPQLDQKLLVTMLGTNKLYLYQAISHHHNANFKNIINRYRVLEAKRIMQEKVRLRKTVSYDTVFADAGFNSITSYYRAFKSFTGLTPKEYLRELREDQNAP